MWKLGISVYSTLLTALLCWSYINAVHVPLPDERNICEECREKLENTIQAALRDLDVSGRCFEISRSLIPIEPIHRPTTEEELLPAVLEWTANFELLDSSLRRYYGQEHCLRNMKKHLKRISCLLKAFGNHGNQCIITSTIVSPSDFSATIEASVNFWRNVTGTLNGFLNN